MSEPASTSDPRFGTLVIVGVGLIGGSIAAAARLRKLAERIVGIGRTESRLAGAVAAGLIDEGSTSVAAAADADFAVVCTPVDRICDDVRALAPVMSPEGLITDAGSTKQLVCEELADLSGADGPAFIGSHPLAGSQLQGFEHSDATLFQDRVCVVTPADTAQANSTQRVEQFWRDLGSIVVRRTPGEHDQALARTSHLPHLVAAALAGSLQPKDLELAASGFRDTTRIAAGDPGLWVPILTHNARSVQVALGELQARLREFGDSLLHDDHSALQKLLEEAKRQRDGLG
jgi:prephenate dehydrogenase